MPVVTLTDISIRALKPVPGRQVIYTDKSLKGFGVRLTSSGVMSFVLTYGDDRRRVKLGDVGIIKLADARAEAKRILAEQTLGAKNEKSIAFADALDLFLTNSEKRNKPRTARDYRRLLTRHFLPALRKKPLSEITKHDISRIIDRLLSTPSECAHAFAALKIFFRWATRRGLVENSPCDSLQGPAKPLARSRVLSDEELRKVLLQARITGFPFGTVLELLIRTGQRRSEIGSLRKSWINFERRTITLPATITKNKREHTFPISETVAELLTAIPHTDNVLFPGKDADTPITGWSNFKAAFDKKCEVESWTLHDLRRTFATNLAALSIRIEVTEKLLNHVSGSFGGIVGVYQRHGYLDEMRAAIDLWEKRLDQIIPQT